MKLKNFLVPLTLTLTLTSTVSAQTSSPSGTIRDSVKQKVAQELAQIKKAVAKRGFVGSITAKSEVSLTISTLKNETRTVTITPDSTVKLQNSKEGTPADLKVGDYVLVMGDVDSQNAMTAKRLLVIGKPTPDPRTVIWGTVIKSSSTSLSLTTKKGDTLNLKLSSVTKFNDKYKNSDVTAGSKVVVVYNTETNLASRVHLVKTASVTPTTTVTTTPKTTPTAKITPTKTPTPTP